MTRAGKIVGMKVTIDIVIDRLPDDNGEELVASSRFWAGAMKQLDLTEPVTHELMDSGYQPVGALTITA